MEYHLPLSPQRGGSTLSIFRMFNMVSLTSNRLKSVSIAYSIRFLAIAPLAYLYMALIIIVALGGASLWLVLKQPYTGLQLEGGPDSLGLKVVSASGPAIGKVVEGDVILSLSSTNGAPIVLNAATMAEDPDYCSTYKQYNDFFRQQALIYESARSRQLNLQLHNGRQVAIDLLPSRPLTSLPLSFWLLQTISALGFLIGVAIWSCRRNLAETRLLAIAGLSFMIGAAALSIYGSRGLVFDPVLFRYLSASNHFANSIYSGSLLLLLCCYPNRLISRPILLPGYALVALIWLNETLQIVQAPLHAYFVPLGIAPMILALELGRRQWLKSALNPVAKASLRWLLFTLLVGCGGVAVILYVPVLTRKELPFPLWGAQLAMLGVFIGFVLCVIRFQIFNIDRWWRNLWVWFFSGLFLIFIDMLLAFYFHINPFYSLTFSVIVTAWLYFPFRQWILSFTKSDLILNPENFLLTTLDLFICNPTPEFFDKHWQDYLAKLFNPLTIKRCQGDLTKVKVADYGLTLQIPLIEKNAFWELNGMEHGARLFGEKEASLVQSTLDLTHKSLEWNKSREEAIKQERERIIRDLHDDVGASLLTLIYTAQTEDQASLAKKALRDLRDTMHAIQNSRGKPLVECLINWKNEIEQRLQPLAIELAWHISDSLPERTLVCRECINLDRIFREAVTNIIKHSHPRKIEFSLHADPGKLVFILDNFDSHAPELSTWQPHVGLFNMQTRAHEIGAQLTWRSMALPHDSFDGVRMTVSIDCRGDQ
jgi:signal transduction histidine kinase